MKTTLKQILKFLDYADTQQKSLFIRSDFAIWFKESPEELQAIMDYCAESTLLTKVEGEIIVFVNRRSQFCPMFIREAIVPYLRPSCVNYMSLEYVLSEYSIISQVPTVVTCMTTGKMAFIETPFGYVEFVTVPQNDIAWKDELHWDKPRQMLFASPKQAYHDLVYANRNLHLVQEDELEEYGITPII